MNWPDDGKKNSRWTQMLTRLRAWGYLKQGPAAQKGLSLFYGDREIEVVDFYLLLKTTKACQSGVPWRKTKTGEKMQWVADNGWPQEGYVGAHKDGTTMTIPPRSEYTNVRTSAQPE